MIYSKNGNSLNVAYNKDGSELDSAFDINGIQIYGDGTVDYDDYSFTQVWSKTVSPAQGFDIYDRKVFWVSKSGNDTVPADCYVWNLGDGSQALESAYVTIYSGHGNNLAFDYPKVYASPAYNPSTVYVNTINADYNFTLTQTLTFGNLYDIDACLDEDDNSILWGLSHDGVGTNLVVTKWDLSDLTDNGDGTYTPQLLQSVNTPRPSGNYMQGTRIHDGMLWFACGSGSQRAYVYAIDPNTGEVMHTIDLQTNTEPEGLAWVLENGRYVLYVGFQGMMMRRYTFG